MDRRRNRFAQPTHHKRRFSLKRRTVLIAAGSLLGIFVLINIVLWGMYSGRTYPKTNVLDTTIGSVAYKDIAQTVTAKDILPNNLTLRHGDTTTTVSLADAGITAKSERTAQDAKQQRSWLPIMNIFKTTILRAPISIDNNRFAAQADKLAPTFTAKPIDAKLVIQNDSVSISEPVNGYSLDKKALQTSITRALDAGKHDITVPITTKQPTVRSAELEDDRLTLSQQIQTPITFRYNGQVKRLATAEVATWFVPVNNTYALSTDKITTSVNDTGKSWGIRVKDSAHVAAAAQKAVNNKSAYDTTLVATTIAKTFTYCTAARGVDASELPALRAKLASTYGDSRGWSINGLIDYKYAATGCDFTVWLSAAAHMPTFGAICDSTWSCRVGPNVVINFDRWRYASPAWNDMGGTLEEYRSMVINHETGHWLGFGHDYCPGAGQPAPVMQQQSINLQGCTFSPWPNATELSTLRTRLGI